MEELLMPHVLPRLLYVSATDPTASWSSISGALRHASTVLVGPGQYSPSQTGEQFPLYVPPGVTLTGSGAGESLLDGEGVLDLSFRPVQAGESLILLGDDTTLSGFTITNSGGNGVGTEPGARVLIVRNTLQQHGQHGLLVSGAREAVIKDNRFLHNGTRQFRPDTPRPAAGRQGHHIFVQGKGGEDNRILIADNILRGAFADALALVVFFDEPDATRLTAQILNNQIEQSERRGLTIAGSFGPCHTRVAIDVRHNVIRDNGAQAIAAQAARPLVTQLVRDSRLRLRIIDNEMHGNPEGIALFGGFGPAEANRLDCTLLANRISSTEGHALRLIGGIGFGGYAARGNRLRAAVSRNRLESAGEVAVFFQGGTREDQEEVSGNTVLAQVIDNELQSGVGKPRILVNDGLPGNVVSLEEVSESYERTERPMPYR
jgi:hypothetical protein